MRVDEVWQEFFEGLDDEESLVEFL